LTTFEFTCYDVRRIFPLFTIYKMETITNMTGLLKLAKQIEACTRCGLHQTRNNTVPGEGDPNADIVLIGEGPGANEDRLGRPFVGQAGVVLNGLLESIGLQRKDVFITNMVKCRPPNNRDPLPVEISACRYFLDAQLKDIDPKVLVTLGRHALVNFFPGESIGKARGKPRLWNKYVIYPIYHPAAALHNPKLRLILKDDFTNLSSIVNSVAKAKPAREAATMHSRQLNLF